MDTAALKSILWFLVWGGLFFVMMRFGCGAHIGGHGGHGHGGGHGGQEPQGGPPTKDPVCGMDVDPQRAAAASVYKGVTYYFCSASCRDKFEKTPEKYVSAPASARPEGGHHHA